MDWTDKFALKRRSRKLTSGCIDVNQSEIKQPEVGLASNPLSSYGWTVGIFSRLKSDAEARRLAVAKESLTTLQPLSTEYLELLKSWVPDDYFCEVNKVEYEAEDVRDAIEFLVLVAVKKNDQQLYSFVGANSEGFRVEFQYITVEGLAQHLFQGTVSSMELRKKYQSEGAVLEAITSLGLAALNNLEQHPKYKEALRYMSKNSDNLL